MTVYIYPKNVSLVLSVVSKSLKVFFVVLYFKIIKKNTHSDTHVIVVYKKLY